METTLSPHSLIQQSSLQRCNRTELYQMCRDAQIFIHPFTPKEALIGYLIGVYQPPAMTEQQQPVNRWRYALIGFLSEHWMRVHPQLKCPAKRMRDPDPQERLEKPCFTCTDVQVMSCVVGNADHEDLIRRHLPLWKGTQ